jgi:hydrogenase maturation protease
MSDDRIGHFVTQIVLDRLGGRQDVVGKELSVSGLKLIEEMLGFDEVIIIDSYTDDERTPGRIRKFAPADFADTLHPVAPHGINFTTALEFYRKLDPEKIPRKVQIYTIDIDSEIGFGEELSPAVERAGRELAELILRELATTQSGE